jgi:hypothetical protein
MLAAYATMRSTMHELHTTGKIGSTTTKDGIFESFTRTMRVPEYQALENKYKT